MKFLLEVWVWVTAYIVFLFVPKEWNRMPKGSFLRYYEDYNYGINGDEQWVNPNLKDHPSTEDEARSYKWRVRWCHRNANTWDHENGLDTRTIVKLEYSGDTGVRNRPSPGKSGTLYIKATDHNGKEWECNYTVKQWGNSGRCYRSYTGYKLKDVLDFYLKVKTLDPRAMDQYNVRRIAAKVSSTNPLMGFER